jgi:SAM-dependent methyltransferase
MYHYAINVFRYGNFSLNMNSRKYWDSRLRVFGDFWRDDNYRQILDLLPEHGMFSLLDVGCALGDGTRLMKESYPQCRIVGCDISEVGIRKARAKDDGVEYILLDILKEEIPGEFDYITIIQTLEHFDEPFAVVEKCLRNCRRSLIISVPYSRDYTGRIRIVDEHKYAFNESTFQGYHCRTVKLTEYIEVSGSRCIIYEIAP